MPQSLPITSVKSNCVAYPIFARIKSNAIFYYLAVLYECLLTALLLTLNNICDLADSADLLGQATLLVSLDLSATFGIIDTVLLISGLSNSFSICSFLVLCSFFVKIISS